MATASAPNQQAGPSNQMTQSGADIFRKAVTYILSEWPSFNIALENGMGGHAARSKREWMINHISDVILTGRDIELEYYLAELIDQEFNTLIEDGSLEYNSHWIIKFYKDCMQGKEQEVLHSINQAASKNQSLGNIRIPTPHTSRESSDYGTTDEDGDDDPHDMNI